MDLGHGAQCRPRMFHPVCLPPTLPAVPTEAGSEPTDSPRTQLLKLFKSAWPGTEGLGQDLSLSLPP